MNLRTTKRVLLLALMLLPACSDDDSGPSTPYKPPSPPPPLAQALTFTRADSTGIQVGDTTWVCCGVWDPGWIDKGAFKVLVYDPANQKAGWKLFLLLDEVQAGRTYTLPTASISLQHAGPVNLFLYDIPGGGNELASDESESRGTITVHSFSCGPPARLDVSIDAVLGSEFGDGPEVRAYGRFQVEATPTSSCDFGY